MAAPDCLYEAVGSQRSQVGMPTPCSLVGHAVGSQCMQLMWLRNAGAEIGVGVGDLPLVGSAPKF